MKKKKKNKNKKMDKNKNLNNINNESKLATQNEKLIKEEKDKLKKQIKELRELILNIESQLDITSYGECEIVDKSILFTDTQSSFSIRQNINDILQYELFKMSGIYCAKITDDEFIFNFSSSSNIKSPYAVQIFTKNNTIQLGAWVMPLGINIDRIISETPLKNAKDIIGFLRNCKRVIDCHAERIEQLEMLKKFTSTIKNVEIDGTLGYKTIILQLLNVYDNSSDKTFNLIVHMDYNIGRVRPNSINIEWNLKDKISEKAYTEMKTFLKCFKTQRLIDAFKKIIEQPHPVYVWGIEEYSDSALDISEIHYFSENDEDIEASDDEKHSRKRRKTRQLRKHIAKPLSNKNRIGDSSNEITKNGENSDKHENDNELELSENISDPKPKSKIRKKNVPSKPVTSIASKMSKSPEKNKNQGLQQTKLSFVDIPTSSVLMNEQKNMKQKMRTMITKKTMTSTPMAIRSIPNKLQSTINSLEISPITKNPSAKVNLKTSKKKSGHIKKEKK